VIYLAEGLLVIALACMGASVVRMTRDQPRPWGPTPSLWLQMLGWTALYACIAVTAVIR
jgi:hypothetical protein